MSEPNEQAYAAKLKELGFRSWKRANIRRGELIDKQVDGSASGDELRELEGLQDLADIYLRWKAPLPEFDFEKFEDEQ